MVDSKSILDAILRGAQPGSQPAAQQSGGFGGIGDILGQLSQAMGQQPAQAASPSSGGGGLGDILGQLQKQLGGAGAAPSSAPAAGAGASAGGGLGDILGQLQKQLGGAGGAAGGGSLMDVLGTILGQATSGVKEGAGRLDEATGASARARDALGQATGKSPDELLKQLQDMMRNNQLGAGAALGGLGALVLGTRTGRAMAGRAAELGALAMIGGLAYKAYQNYSQGKPLVTGKQALIAPPDGSGFESDAISNDDASLYIRAMIAAAAADGRIDANEQKKIMGGLAQAGLDDAAHSFLRQELQNPASIDDLAAAVSTPAEAVQVYTAARLAVDASAEQEHEFLAALADKLGLDPNLVAHIEATAASAS